LLDKQAKANAEKEKLEQEKIDKNNIDDLLDQNIDYLPNPNLENAFKDVINIVNNQQKGDLEVLLSTNSVDYLAYYTKIGYSIRQVIDVISI
jgi:hypothetical protein